MSQKKSSEDVLKKICYVVAALIALCFTVIFIYITFKIVAGFFNKEVFISIKDQGEIQLFHFEYIMLMLTCVLITLGISALMPQFVTRSKIKDIIDERYKKYEPEIEEKYKSKIEEQDRKVSERILSAKDEVLSAEAHSSRMTAFFLLSQKRYTWAIGWASKAIGRYYRCIKAKNTESYRDLENQCILFIVNSICGFVTDNKKELSEKTESHHFSTALSHIMNKNKYEEGKNVPKRAFANLLDFRKEQLKHKGEKRFIETKEEGEIIDKFIMIIYHSFTYQEKIDCEKSGYFIGDEFKEILNKYSESTNLRQDFAELCTLVTDYKAKQNTNI